LSKFIDLIFGLQHFQLNHGNQVSNVTYMYSTPHHELAQSY